ncbi:SMC-Scp complex subunit ScpB [Candidatus Cyanaurora vandensis]|uniref:SMC-Scp complex subunit ScpB n=1 Tax=Candidatus Cyanaurora vandensis TaxID=2714958 RepID=UPI00257BB66A|nr:SMC-Scp complex subunit ScpB [Candidatus Cyanaurora vandensis]
MDLTRQLEAILYLKARPLTVVELAHLSHQPEAQVFPALLELLQEYSRRDSALEVVESSQGYALQLKPEFEPLVHEIASPELGMGARRTLAVIALRGPLSQRQLVELRGSGVYDHVRDLVEKSFITKYREAEGRSFRLKVTERFYQYFAINEDLSDLLVADRQLELQEVPPL